MGGMHIPDGFIDAQVSAAAAVVAAGGVALAVRASRRELADNRAPLAGLVAVFVFAAQMVNFPVGAGTSGHLIGGALAAILVGPATAVLAMTVVLTVQALVFADGGITAWGLNVLNLAIVAPLIAWLAFRLLTRLLGTGRGSVLAASAAAGLLSVLGAAASFGAEFALGGTEALSAGAVLVAMLAVHVPIGAIEGAVTAMIVGAVLAARPDLVRGVADRLPAPVVLPASQPETVGR